VAVLVIDRQGLAAKGWRLKAGGRKDEGGIGDAIINLNVWRQQST
jgi:hypothetical protein